MNEPIQKDILHELRLIKRLLAQNLLVGESQTKQIAKLNAIGFKPKEIAEILGTTANTVNVALNRQRKSKKKQEAITNQ
jgi:DNA-directed RNA polymerase specialized sigma24 family protein